MSESFNSKLLCSDDMHGSLPVQLFRQIHIQKMSKHNEKMIVLEKRYSTMSGRWPETVERYQYVISDEITRTKSTASCHDGISDELYAVTAAIGHYAKA